MIIAYHCCVFFHLLLWLAWKKTTYCHAKFGYLMAFVPANRAEGNLCGLCSSSYRADAKGPDPMDPDSESTGIYNRKFMISPWISPWISPIQWCWVSVFFEVPQWFLDVFGTGNGWFSICSTGPYQQWKPWTAEANGRTSNIDGGMTVGKWMCLRNIFGTSGTSPNPVLIYRHHVDYPLVMSK